MRDFRKSSGVSGESYVQLFGLHPLTDVRFMMYRPTVNNIDGLHACMHVMCMRNNIQLFQ